jgi:hypothetical protein
MKETKYRRSLHPQLARWIARWGLSDEEIAKEMGLSAELFKEWQQHKEFFAAVEDGRNYWATLAKDSLQKLIKGYDCEESSVEIDGDGKPLHIKKTTRHIPPNSQAVIFHMKNHGVFKIAEELSTDGCDVMECPYSQLQSLLAK